MLKGQATTGLLVFCCLTLLLLESWSAIKEPSSHFRASPSWREVSHEFSPHSTSCTNLRNSPALTLLRNMSTTLNRPLSFLQGATRCFPYFPLLNCGLRPHACFCQPKPLADEECVPTLSDWQHILAKKTSPVKYHTLFLSTDTTRQDVLMAALGLEEGVTRDPSIRSRFSNLLPRVKALMSDPAHPALAFPRYTTSAPWTRPSHASTLTGWTSELSGIMDSDHLLKVPQLAHHLGVPSYAFINNNGNLQADRAVTPEQLDAMNQGREVPISRVPVKIYSFGYDHFANTPHLYWEQHDDTVAFAKKQLQVVNAGEDPSLVFFHTNVMHVLAHEYPASAAKLDEELADVLSEVDWDRTIVIWTSDHGQGIEPGKKRVEHQARMHRDLVDGILVAWLPPALREQYPQSFSQGISWVPAQALDFLPTLLDLHGIDHSHIPFPGCNFFRRAESFQSRRKFPFSIAEDRHSIQLADGQYTVLGHTNAKPANHVNLRMEQVWPMKWAIGQKDGTTQLQQAFNMLYDPDEMTNLLDIPERVLSIARDTLVIVPCYHPSWKYQMERSELPRLRFGSIVTLLDECSSDHAHHWTEELLHVAFTQIVQRRHPYALLMDSNVWPQDGFLRRFVELMEETKDPNQLLLLGAAGLSNSKHYYRQVVEFEYQSSGWSRPGLQVTSGDWLDPSALFIQHPEQLDLESLSFRTSPTQSLLLSFSTQQRHQALGDALVFYTSLKEDFPGYSH